MDVWKGRLRRFLNRGLTETGLAVLLLAMTAIAFEARLDSTTVLVVECTACVGAAITAWFPRAGATVVCASLAVMATLPPDSLTLGLYAPLVVVLSCAWHDGFRAAAVTTAWGYAVSVFVSLRRTATLAQDAQALLLWAGFYAFPWLLGLAFRRVQLTELSRSQARLLAREAEIAAQTDERRRLLAGDLHDKVNHNLTLITMAAEATRVDPHGDPWAALARIADTSRQTRRNVDTLMRMLQAGRPSPPTSLTQELREGSVRLADAGFGFQADPGLDTNTLEPDVSDALGRIVREAINNVIRHGDRREPCRASIRNTAGTLALTFTNATTEPYSGDHFGIAGMRERAEIIGGTLQAGPVDGHWTLEVSVPLAVRHGNRP